MNEPKRCHAKRPVTARVMSGISVAGDIYIQKQLVQRVQGGISPPVTPVSGQRQLFDGVCIKHQ